VLKPTNAGAYEPDHAQAYCAENNDSAILSSSDLTSACWRSGKFTASLVPTPGIAPRSPLSSWQRNKFDLFQEFNCILIQRAFTYVQHGGLQHRGRVLLGVLEWAGGRTR
jgi:hypothetical protein